MKKSFLHNKILLLLLVGLLLFSDLSATWAYAATSSSASSSYTAGDNIAIGRFDGIKLNWTILEYDATTGVAFVVSRNTIKSKTIQEYKKALTDKYPGGDTNSFVNWENNLWRAFLNEIFYNRAFSDDEKAMIQDTTITAASHKTALQGIYHDTTYDRYYLDNNDKNSLNLDIYNNQTTTTDKLFFLSFSDIESYNDTISYGSSDVWPLRTNAYDDPAKTLFMNETRSKTIERLYHYQGTGIRPAMYVKIEDVDSGEDSDTGKSTASSKTSAASATSSSKASGDSTTREASSKSSSSSSSAKATSTSSATSKSKVTAKKKSYKNNATESGGGLALPDTATYSLKKGGSVQTTIDLSYLNSTGKSYSVEYMSSDSNIFSVDSSGKVTAGSDTGSATLTVRMKKSNGKVYTMTCRIDVT